MRFGYPEQFLLYAGVMSFHNLTWSIGLAAFSCLMVFFRFAMQIQEKKEERERSEKATQVLTEQAEELGQALSKLFGGDASQKKAKKYSGDVH